MSVCIRIKLAGVDVGFVHCAGSHELKKKKKKRRKTKRRKVLRVFLGIGCEV